LPSELIPSALAPALDGGANAPVARLTRIVLPVDRSRTNTFVERLSSTGDRESD
jgi:hypothetical protein